MYIPHARNRPAADGPRKSTKRPGGKYTDSESDDIVNDYYEDGDSEASKEFDDHGSGEELEDREDSSASDSVPSVPDEIPVGETLAILGSSDTGRPFYLVRAIEDIGEPDDDDEDVDEGEDRSSYVYCQFMGFPNRKTNPFLASYALAWRDQADGKEVHSNKKPTEYKDVKPLTIRVCPVTQVICRQVKLQPGGVLGEDAVQLILDELRCDKALLAMRACKEMQTRLTRGILPKRRRGSAPDLSTGHIAKKPRADVTFQRLQRSRQEPPTSLTSTSARAAPVAAPADAAQLEKKPLSESKQMEQLIARMSTPGDELFQEGFSDLAVQVQWDRARAYQAETGLRRRR